MASGEIKINTVNVSQNKNDRISGITCELPFHKDNENEPDVRMSYCSFNNNSVESYTCIQFDKTNNEKNSFKIECCNIINNEQPNNAEKGLIHCIGETIIENSCIRENVGSPTFLGNQQITIKNCSLISITFSGSVIIEDVANVFINELSFINTGNCVTQYDNAYNDKGRNKTCMRTKKLFSISTLTYVHFTLDK